MSERIVYLNDAFLPITEAKVSVLDRGFLFGDGVYEVIPVYGGRLFRLAHHLERLAQSLQAIHLDNPRPSSAWKELLEGLVARNGGGEQSLYLQVTRGVAPRDLAIPEDLPPTVFAMSNPVRTMDVTDLRAGARAITVQDIRWQHCNIKAITLLANVLLHRQATVAGVDEAIILHDGLVTEGTASNIFVVSGGVVLTPPKGPRLLPGVTRDLVVALCRRHAIPCEERQIELKDLQHAEEIWLTSSTREILPLLEIDQRPIANGRPGPIWEEVIGHYQAYKQAFREGTEA